MKKLPLVIFIVSICLSASAFAAPPILTTKITEIQFWDSGFGYYFKVENPDLINPAGCDQSEWMVVERYPRGSFILVENLREQLIYANRNDKEISIAISETRCDRSQETGMFPQIRSVIFQ